jgi:DNA-binding transcriptional ArsR family regulator
MTQFSLWQAMADPTRSRIIEILKGKERSVTEIVQQVDIDQSGVSRHLRLLQEAGIVQSRAEGQRRIYSLRPEPFQDLAEWMGEYRHLWEGRLSKFDEALTKQNATTTSNKKRRRNDER